MFEIASQSRTSAVAHTRQKSSGRFAWGAALIAAAAIAMAASASSAIAAQPAVNLATANSFALLAGSAITNTGPSTVNGNLGLSPGSAVSGFPPATLNGTAYITDAVAGIAQNDLTTAYNDAAGRTPVVPVAADLGGLTVTPGVFSSASSLGLTGALTLNALGNADSVFIFKAGSTLTTATDSRVNLINGAQACNVFWQVGSSATLGSASQFIGSIMALTSVSVNDAATVNGRLLARNGAVTLINDTVSVAPCAPGTTGGEGGPLIGAAPGGSGSGSAALATIPNSVGRLIGRFGTDRCIDRSFKVSVKGVNIAKVVFTVGGRQKTTRTKSPFSATVQIYEGGTHTVIARVTYTDGTQAALLRLKFKSCGEASAQPPRKPIGFTG